MRQCSGKCPGPRPRSPRSSRLRPKGPYLSSKRPFYPLLWARPPAARMGQPSAKIAYGKNLIAPETAWHGPKSVANGSQHLRAGAEKPTWRTMFNDSSSLLAHLSTRRSGKARDMVAPGPDAAQLKDIVMLALRTPDHGKLAPWRIVTITDDRRDAFAALLTKAWVAEHPAAAGRPEKRREGNEGVRKGRYRMD